MAVSEVAEYSALLPSTSGSKSQRMLRQQNIVLGETKGRTKGDSRHAFFVALTGWDFSVLEIDPGALIISIFAKQNNLPPITFRWIIKYTKPLLCFVGIIVAIACPKMLNRWI